MSAHAFQYGFYREGREEHCERRPVFNEAAIAERGHHQNRREDQKKERAFTALLIRPVECYVAHKHRSESDETASQKVPAIIRIPLRAYADGEVSRLCLH